MSPLNLSLSSTDLHNYTTNLLDSYFPVPRGIGAIPLKSFTLSLERLEHCFSHIKKKYYYSDGVSLFDHLNGDHMCTYLWFLSNTIWNDTQDSTIPTALSYLNKVIHSVDLFYSVPMPDIFLLVHPVGSVFGSAKYSNYFVGYQNCTIGADKGAYPVLSSGVICYSRSSIIGSCSIGSNVVLAANSFVLNTDVPDSCIVSGYYPTNKFSPNLTMTTDRVFNDV